MIIKKFKLFLERKNNRIEYIQNISDYIFKKTNIRLFDYGGLFDIKRSNLNLKGKLLLTLNQNNKAIRINWIEGSNDFSIHSIDLWFDFNFNKDPDYTLELPMDNSIVKYLNSIVKFFNNPRSINELNTDEPTSHESVPEESKLEDNYDNLEIDVFKTIELFTMQVAMGNSNSLIVSGTAGVGKTHIITDTLSKLGLINNKDFFTYTGKATSAGLYEVLFLRRNSLIMFDDLDNIWKDEDSVNMLKGALDTYPVREISKVTATNTFDSVGMTDAEIEAQYKSTGKLPNRFGFRGKIIFISNLKKFDSAIVSRSLYVNIDLTQEEIVDRLKTVLYNISPGVKMDIKEEALNYLIYIVNKYPAKFDLNIRTLIHCVNIRLNNDMTMNINGKSAKVWKLLIKQYVVSN